MHILQVLALVLSALVATPTAFAESRDSSEYREAINLGIAEFDERHFLEARSHFSRAHDLYQTHGRCALSGWWHSN